MQAGAKCWPRPRSASRYCCAGALPVAAAIIYVGRKHVLTRRDAPDIKVALGVREYWTKRPPDERHIPRYHHDLDWLPDAGGQVANGALNMDRSRIQ
jgi:hypothetical protein